MPLVYVEERLPTTDVVWYHERGFPGCIPIQRRYAEQSKDLRPCPGCFPNDEDERHGAECIDTPHGPAVRYEAG